MRHDIQPNERAFSSKEVAEEVGIATPTVRKYSQALERNGYEFLKEGPRRIFVRNDILALRTIRDSERSLDDTARDIVEQQKERLEGSNETSIAIRDTDEQSLDDPQQLKELLQMVAKELAAAREKNIQLTNDMTVLQTTVSRLQQDHHMISAGIGNQAQKTQASIEKLAEQQKAHYEKVLQEEKKRNDYLHKEIKQLRDEQKEQWQTQKDFNERFEVAVHKPRGMWEKLASLFRL